MRTGFLLLAVCVHGASASGTQANPMRKIINMLQQMAKELEHEGEVEKELFEKMMCACETGQKELSQNIDDATADIETFESKISQETAEDAQLKQEVVDHKSTAASAKEDLEGATKLREKEHKKFAETEKANSLSIKQLDQAIPALEKGLSGASFMQSMKRSVTSRLRRVVEVTKYLSTDDRTAVLAFMDEGSGEEMSDSVQAPGTEQILGMIKTMREEMAKDLNDLKNDEKSDAETFTDLKESKTQEITVNEKAVISKEKRTGELALSLSNNKHALEDAQEQLANAQKFAANMKEECASRDKDRALREKARNAEITAISEAVKILNDDDALETFSKAKSAALIQHSGPLQATYDAFMQIRVRTHRISASRATAKQEPERNYGEEAKSAFGTFVNGMVNGMVKVLHDEDVGDEIKMAWCKKELAKNEAVKEEKTTQDENLKTAIEEAEDSIETLTEEIKGLVASIAEMDKQVHEWTEQRKKEHEEFVTAYATSATAMRLIDKAMMRLQKFYSPKAYAEKEAAVKEAAMKKAGLALLHKSAKSSEHTAAVKQMEAKLGAGFDDDSFLQLRATTQRDLQPALPDTPSGPPAKKESGGVIALMEEFKTDLKLDMTESEMEEKHAAQEYTRVMGDAQETRKADSKSLNKKKSAKAKLDSKLVVDKEQKELLEEELHNLELYLVKLNTECSFIVKNFENRHDGRVDEETGLESAKTIVTHEEPPTHREVEKTYDEEVTKEDVDEHFPDGFPVEPE